LCPSFIVRMMKRTEIVPYLGWARNLYRIVTGKPKWTRPFATAKCKDMIILK
jgi:hypothetical protein